MGFPCIPFHPREAPLPPPLLAGFMRGSLGIRRNSMRAGPRSGPFRSLPLREGELSRRWETSQRNHEDKEGSFAQRYLPEGLEGLTLYEAMGEGFEERVRERLKALRGQFQSARPPKGGQGVFQTLPGPPPRPPSPGGRPPGRPARRPARPTPRNRR